MIVAAIAGSLVLTARLPGTEILADRVRLMRRSLLLAGDYFFTGAGLGMFPMQYSIYILLIHPYQLPHSHNLLLNLVIEQGLLGPAAYAAMAGACLAFALRRLPSASRGRTVIIEAGVTSLAISLADGLFNDSLYSSRGALFLLLPFGVVMGAAGTHTRRRASHRKATARPGRRLAIVPVLITVLAGAIIGSTRGVRAAVFANAGALAQAKAELPVYDPDLWPNPSIDDVRRQEDLTRAQALLATATDIDPGNRTARQRLAAIALSRADYEAAFTHTSAAWETGHRDEVTRLRHGDALVAKGQPELAADTVRGLEWAAPRLRGQARYRYWSTGDYQRAVCAWETVLLLVPDDKASADWAARARKKLAE
jgi:hypothetical protein